MRWPQPAWAGLAVLGVLILAYLNPRPNDFWQIAWASMGAAGTTYAWPVLLRNRRIERARRAAHENGLYGLVCQAALGAAWSNFIGLVLVASSGIMAILGGPREVVISLLMGVGAVLTHAAWFAERKAEQQRRFIRERSEPDPS